MSYKSGFTGGVVDKTPKYALSEKVIVLAQHGYKGNRDQFRGGFIKVVEEAGASGFYHFESNDHVLVANDSLESTIDAMNAHHSFDDEKIKYFLIRTEFTNNIDRVRNQIVELDKIINKLKEKTHIEHFYLLGHSKGGLVNMQYSISYPRKVEKLISVGTPYNPNCFGFLQARLDDIFVIPAVVEALVNDGDLNGVCCQLYKMLNDTMSDEDLGSSLFYKLLKNGWEHMKNEDRPIVYAIGASQIGISRLPITGGDLVVAVTSQLADGYSHINFRKLLKDNYVYVVLDSLWDTIKLNFNVVERIKDIYQALQQTDILSKLLGFILAFMVPDNKDNEVYDLIHTRECANKSVVLAIIDACKAVPKTQDELNPRRNTEYK